MPPEWITYVAVAESAAIVTYAAAPVVSSARDALTQMGESVEQDVDAGD